MTELNEFKRILALLQESKTKNQAINAAICIAIDAIARLEAGMRCR